MNDNSFLVILVILIIIALIAREFWCWYWKQNKIVSLLQSINKKLDNYNINLENNSIGSEISGEKIKSIKNKVDGDALQEDFGEYSKDKLKKEQEIKEEETDKQKREEIINNVKNQTKEMANKTFDKINDILKSNPTESSEKVKVCECGEKIKDGYVFCTNCGKKLK